MVGMMGQMAEMMDRWMTGMMAYGVIVSLVAVVVLVLLAVWLFQRVTRRTPV